MYHQNSTWIIVSLKLTKKWKSLLASDFISSSKSFQKINNAIFVVRKKKLNCDWVKYGFILN